MRTLSDIQKDIDETQALLKKQLKENSVKSIETLALANSLRTEYIKLDTK